MKILYLKLENFATIFTAMGKTSIEIDFTKCKNNIVLLVGKNGSGKTSILSSLHPFAYPGNMDIRSGASLIMENKNGYKEIVIDFNGDIYTIKHHYTRASSGSISVKSYIALNQEELNPNGNVTSFNETVYRELSLQQDYLKLLRLGSNVTNIIQMKSSERKNFTSELLNDIGVYTELFKKISEDSRVIKRMMSAVASKMERINVTDKDIIIKEIKFIENNISLLSSDRDAIYREKGTIEGSISTLVPEGLETFIAEISQLKKSCEQKKKEIYSLTDKMSDIPVIIIGNAEEYHTELKEELNKLSSELYSIDPLIKTLQSNLNSYYNEKDSIEIQLSTLTSDEKYQETEHIVSDLRAEVMRLNDKFNNIIPTVTKDGIFSVMNMMKEIDSLASETYGFGMGNLRFFVSLMTDGVNIEEYVNDEIKKLDREIIKINSKFRSEINPDDCIVLFRPCDCTIDDCPYLDLYDRFFHKEEESTEESSVVSLETQKENLNNLLYINSNVEYMRRLLRTNETILQKLNMKKLSLENILYRMCNDEPVYEEIWFSRMISNIEDYEEYQAKKSELKDLELKLSGMKGSTELLDSLNNRLVSVYDEITKIENSIKDNQLRYEKLETEITNKKSVIEDVEEYIATDTNIDMVTSELDSLYESVRNNEDKLSRVKELADRLSYVNTRIQDYDSRLKHLNDEHFEKSYKLKEFTNLEEEQRVLSDKYDEIEVIRESLSSTKGIPLLFIQLYFKNIRIFVNQLLDSVYDDFTIEDFNITTTDFLIPYTKNGVSVSDVVHASQGETSFLSLALSFALINNSIKDYNILLLDEIDSTLDMKNRSMFLNIIEEQISTIDAEQVFLITHNNMFDSYPVDIIMTSDMSLDSYTNANIIYST